MRIVGLILALFAAGAVAASDCYSGRGYYYTPTYYSYPITYTLSNPGADQSDVIKSLTAAHLKSSKAALDSKDEVIKVERERNAALQALISSGAPIPPELKAAMMPAPKHPGLALVLDTCAKCHGKAGGAADGGGKVMWDGDVFIGTGEQLNKCRDRIENGSMPPRAKWDWDKKGPALSGLTRMKIAGAVPPDVKAELPK